MISNDTSSLLRLGIRAHDLGCFPADELARRVREVGMDCVQLALAKAIRDVELRPGMLDSGMSEDIGNAFCRYGVRIEVLGCYINPIHPDAATRELMLGLFKEHLRHARDFGCGIVALESGSLNGDQSYHPGNSGEIAYLDLLGSMRELVAEAELSGCVVGIEAVSCHVLSTPERMRRLLDDIPSPHLQVVFDPVNLLSRANFLEHREVMRRSFNLFGERIAVVHAKDFRTSMGNLVTCPAGTGMMDYPLLLAWLSRHKPGIAVLLEDVPPGQAAKCGRLISKQFLLPVS